MQSRTKVITAFYIILLALSFILYKTELRFWHSTPLYSIGLIYVPSMAYHERVNNALMQEINLDKRFAVKEFTAASALDPLLVNATCDAALDSNVNLVICTGIACSRGFAQMAKKRQSTKPMVFMGVNNPVGVGIVSSLENPGGNITGVFSASFENKVDIAMLLLALKPTTKKVLLPYAAVADGNEPLALKIKQALKANFVDVTLLPINNPNETIAICTTMLPEHDMLMYLEADPIASNGSGLGKLASQYGVTMFASSIDGVKDAAFSYASDPAPLARVAFTLAKEILHSGCTPKDMPIQAAPNDRVLTIKKNLFDSQGLEGTSPQRVVMSLRKNEKLALAHNCIRMQ